MTLTFFYKNPFQALNGAKEEGEEAIETSTEDLEQLRTNPEIYRDPLKLFEVRIRQQELLIGGTGKAEAEAVSKVD